MRERGEGSMNVPLTDQQAVTLSIVTLIHMAKVGAKESSGHI